MHVLIHIYENLNSEIEVKEIIENANVIKTVINTHWNANRKMHMWSRMNNLIGSERASLMWHDLDTVLYG